MVLGWTLCWIVVLLAIAQSLATLIYVRRLLSYKDVIVPHENLPEALVILSLRGGDEGLVDCLNGLARQEYPRYQLKIVIDHVSDPAHEIVARWMSTSPRVPVSIEFLQNPSEWSSLKCSGVRQALRNLDPRIGAIVMVDGDADAYPYWLRDLISPLTQPGVGAVTGNRWYFPADAAIGSWCRFIYNGLSLPAMDWFALTWGGSLAVRREVALSESFLHTLEHASCEDHAVKNSLAAHGLSLHFNPRVILLNPESCGYLGCLQFVFRQLLWTRLYHPAWLPILGHALGSYLILATTFLLAAGWVMWPEYRNLSGWLFASLGLHITAVVGSLLVTDAVIRHVSLGKQGVNSRLSFGTRLKTIAYVAFAAPWTLVLYTIAILKATLARRVVWREVVYEVLPSGNLRVVTHHPLAKQRGQSQADRSRSAA